MNRYSIRIEPEQGTAFARIWNRDNAAPEKDDTWMVCWEDDTFLRDTHIPVVYRRETARAIARLIIKKGLVDIVVFDTPEGWGVYITLCPDLEVIRLRGVGATPLDAIRNSNFYPSPLCDI